MRLVLWYIFFWFSIERIGKELDKFENFIIILDFLNEGYSKLLF